MENKESFYVIGIPVRTTNEDGRSMTDIVGLWNKFISEDIIKLIPNKVDSTIYSVYMEYESDHLHPYTTLLGAKVLNLDKIPEGMTGAQIEAGKFEKFVAKGDPAKSTVYNKWLEIWNTPIDRAYKADYEVYDDSSQKGSDSIVDIFISVK